MKLCIDAGPLENGHKGRGIGWCTRSLLCALTPELLAKHQVELHYLKRTPLGEDVASSARFARRSPVTGWIGTGGRLPDRLTERWKSAAGTFRLVAEISGTGGDLFFSTDPNAIAISRRFRTVALLYDLIPLRFPSVYLPRHALFRRANYAWQLSRIRRADHLIAISEASRRDAIELLGVPPSRISVVPLAVDRSRFRPMAAADALEVVAERFGLDRPYFLYVGSVDPRKNLAPLFSAFSQLLESSDALLVMAGTPGSLGLRLRQEVERTPIGRRIRWLGYVPEEDLPALYSGALALVFPSLYEGFGLPVLEAMSCGAPVITSPLSSLPEVAGDAAYYAHPDSLPELGEALRRIAAEPGLREELRARGLERAQQFSWTDTAERILKVCRAVFEGATGPRQD